MTLTLYCDGGVIKENPSPFGGTWAFIILDHNGAVYQFGLGAFRPTHLRLDSPVTNNQTEMYAMLRGLQHTPINGEQPNIFSDSEVTIGRVSRGWKWTNMPALLHEWYRVERERRLDTWAQHYFTLLDGHPTRKQLASGIGKRGHPVSEYNMRCDKMCHMAGERLMVQSVDYYEKISGVYPHELA